MKHFRKLLLLTILLPSASFLFAQNSDINDVKRMFIYNFIKYIEWPQEASSSNFKIAVFEEDKMFDVLKTRLDGAKRKGKPIVVEKIDITSSLEDFQVLYLPRSKSKMLKELRDKSAKHNLLLVTDKNGLSTRGSGINFKEVNNKLRFEISIDELSNRGLKVASQLKKVAIVL